MSDVIQVVCGALSKPYSPRHSLLFYLAGRRRLGGAWGGAVEFPGGKVDAQDASPEEALKREWREELGLDIDVVSGPLATIHHRPPLVGAPFDVTLYRVALTVKDDPDSSGVSIYKTPANFKDRLDLPAHEEVFWATCDGLLQYWGTLSMHAFVSLLKTQDDPMQSTEKLPKRPWMGA